MIKNNSRNKIELEELVISLIYQTKDPSLIMLLNDTIDNQCRV